VEVRVHSEAAESHYNGVCNAALWPTYHDAVIPSEYSGENWSNHEIVTRAFADAVTSHAAPGAVVWIHDYQLQLLPKPLRQQRPDLAIGFFLHIPFPPPEIFMRLPWRQAIVDGLRHAHVIGFQTAQCLRNFRRVLSMTADADLPWSPELQPRLVVAPVSIDTDRLAAAAGAQSTVIAAQQLRKQLGDPKVLLLGVDRLDYTKGLVQKVRAVQSLLADGSLDSSQVVFLQIASPTRVGNVMYRQEAERMSRAFGQEGGQQTAVGTLLVDVQRTQPVYSVLELRLGADLLSPHPLEETARHRLTLDYWRDWVQRLHVPNVHRDAVIRSALTLKALCYERTGAILAAAATSLPEGVGGVRNWDYRYCWIRDAAISAKALVNIGSTEEAQAFLLWLHVVIAEATAPERLHPLYTVLGTTLGTEAVVDSLPGYGGSRPVRVGNAAQGQVQLDVFGPVVDLIASLVALRGRATENDLWLTRACVNAVQARWQEPDHGIWEIRDQPLHHVHSKVMCWLAVTRGIEVLAAANEHSPQWEHLQQEIAVEVLDQGWHEALQAYVCAYDRRELDAAALHIGLTDLLPADDPRLVSTIEAVEAGLRAGPTVLRYTYDDGLPGREGGMIICATWLVECYARAGMLDSAHELLRQVLECSGSTGLLSEQWDQERGCGLGNHPQAYSHAGVIQAALALERHDHRSR
jgi:hypothetical protein